MSRETVSYVLFQNRSDAIRCLTAEDDRQAKEKAHRAILELLTD